jgi:uncharacterized protein YcaQ
LGCFGLAPVEDVRWRRWGSRHRLPVETVHAMAKEGEIALFEVEGKREAAFCALAAPFREAVDADPDERRLHILSPFDSLVIRRGWLEDLFGFRYKLEAYKPAAEREYGYFSLPVLWGQRFAGRVDAKADRKTGQLILRQFTFEPDAEAEPGLFSALPDRLRSFARFNGCDEIVLERTEPERLDASLRRALGA